MKRKTLVAVLLILAICVALCACSDSAPLYQGEYISITNVEATEDGETSFQYQNNTENYLTGYIKVDITSENGKESWKIIFEELAPGEVKIVKYNKTYDFIKSCEVEYQENIEWSMDANIIDDANDEVIKEAWDTYIKDYYSFGDFVYTIKEYTEENAFAEEVCRLDEELKLEEMNNFETDLLEFYLRGEYDERTAFDIQWEDVSNLWKVGYDDNNSVINKSDKLYLRTILLQIGENTKKYPKYTDFEMPGRGVYKNIVNEEKNAIGFSTNRDNGIWNNSLGHPQLNGTPYKRVDSQVVNEFFAEKEELLSLIEKAYERYFKEYQENSTASEQNKQQAEIDAKNAEPKIGMTKDEVTNGAWGAPDDKNISEYEWGTEEQWVYDGKGYVYFENGIVDAIQYR